jgi:hypothetical protein
MQAIHHHRKACAALDRAPRLPRTTREARRSGIRVPDTTSEWIERYCLFMASVALHVAAKHRQPLAVIERGRLR